MVRRVVIKRSHGVHLVVAHGAFVVLIHAEVAPSSPQLIRHSRILIIPVKIIQRQFLFKFRQDVQVVGGIIVERGG